MTVLEVPRRARRRRPPRVTFTGVLGELLLTGGVLVLAFLGWQLWLNNVVTAGKQSTAAAELSREWLGEPAPVDPVPAGEPPVMSEPATEGDSIAVMYVPRFGPDWKRTIRQGVDAKTVLNSYTSGVGHYPGTQMPGQVGNFAIAGHDSGWGNTFIDLRNLHIGDRIYIQTKDGWYTYQHRNTEYVQPAEIDVLQPVPRLMGARPAERLLTITTCNPPFAAGERLISYNVFEGFTPASDVPPEIATALAG